MMASKREASGQQALARERELMQARETARLAEPVETFQPGGRNAAVVIGFDGDRRLGGN